MLISKVSARCRLIGKVAADHSHKWVFQEAQQEHDVNLITSWSSAADSVSISETTPINKHGSKPSLYDSDDAIDQTRVFNQALFVCGIFAASKDMGGSVQVWY